MYYYLIQFILGIVMACFIARIVDFVEKMQNTTDEDTKVTIKSRLGGTIFGLVCFVILSAGLLSSQLDTYHSKELEGLYERVTALEMTNNDK